MVSRYGNIQDTVINQIQETAFAQDYILLARLSPCILAYQPIS